MAGSLRATLACSGRLVGRMDWPRDDGKWARVRARMKDDDLDALVVRAPDNLVYLVNYWPMKGYEIVVFPRKGEPTLIVIEPQLEEAASYAWTTDVRPFAGYHESDPRPPVARATDIAVSVLQEYGLTGRIGLELSQGTQSADRMVGEPTTTTWEFFTAFAQVASEVTDASPLLSSARAIKTSQELERMGLANELAANALGDVEANLRGGMRASEVGARFESHVHSEGVGYRGKVSMARAFTLVWSGENIRTFTATSAHEISQNEPTLLEIWVCADGYWTDLTKNLCPGPLTPRYDRLLDTLLEIFAAARAHVRDGASLPALDRLIRERIAEAGFPGQPSHPVAHGVGARAHEPPYAHQAQIAEIAQGMTLAIEPAIYWPGGGGLRLEDVFHVTPGGCQPMSGFPDDLRERMDKR